MCWENVRYTTEKDDLEAIFFPKSVSRVAQKSAETCRGNADVYTGFLPVVGHNIIIEMT